MIGRPFAFMLTGGNAADSPVAPHLLAGLKGARYLLADKGYDANSLRRHLRQRAIIPVIPGRSNRKRVIRYDAKRYKSRHLIENAFCRLKDFRRVATRYDKLARNFLSAVALATLVAFWIGLSLNPNSAFKSSDKYGRQLSNKDYQMLLNTTGSVTRLKHRETASELRKYSMQFAELIKRCEDPSISKASKLKFAEVIHILQHVPADSALQHLLQTEAGGAPGASTTELNQRQRALKTAQFGIQHAVTPPDIHTLMMPVYAKVIAARINDPTSKLHNPNEVEVLNGLQQFPQFSEFMLQAGGRFNPDYGLTERGTHENFSSFAGQFVENFCNHHGIGDGAQIGLALTDFLKSAAQMMAADAGVPQNSDQKIALEQAYSTAVDVLKMLIRKGMSSTARSGPVTGPADAKMPLGNDIQHSIQSIVSYAEPEEIQSADVIDPSESSRRPDSPEALLKKCLLSMIGTVTGEVAPMTKTDIQRMALKADDAALGSLQR